MRLFYLTWFSLKSLSNDIKYFVLLPLLPILVLLSLNPLLRFVQEEAASSTGFQIAVSDQSGNGTVRMAMTSILQSNSLGQSIEVLQVQADEAYKLIEENEIAAAILIPENFVEDIEAGSASPITVLLNERQPMQAALLQEDLTSAGTIMGDVQNVLYMISHYARQVDGLDAGEVFNQSMLTLILDALARDDIYSIESVSPYGEVDPILYYGIAVLLIFLCFSSFYLLLKQTDAQRLALVRREHLAGISELLFPLSQGLSMGILLFLQGLIPCICLLALTGCLSVSSLSVWPVLLCVCIGLGLFVRLVQMCLHKSISALLLLSGLYAVSILLSGIVIPPAYINGNIWSAIQYVMLPRYWSQGLLLAAAGSGQGYAMANTLTISVLLLFPVLCILLMGGLRRVGKELS